jgi:DNA-binding XRE family transcriptional regulator
MTTQIQHHMPLRKARLALGLTTSEAGQYVHVTRKTWEAWELGEVNGKPAPQAKAELFFSKLEKIGSNHGGRSLVVVLVRDPHTGHEQPIDVVADDNYLGLEESSENGACVIKSLAIMHGRPYVHRTQFLISDNRHVMKFCEKNTPI